MDIFEMCSNVHQKYDDFKIENVELATRIMKGKTNKPHAASKEDIILKRKLKISGIKGNKEDRYKYYQISREIYESGVVLGLEMLKKVEIKELQYRVLGGNLNILEKLLINYTKHINRKCIKKAVTFKKKMTRLGNEMGKKEVCLTNIDMDKIIKEYL